MTTPATWGSANVHADATAAAQSHVAAPTQSLFQGQPAEAHREASMAKASSGRLFPDTAAGHMAMVYDAFACLCYCLRVLLLWRS